MSSAAEPTAPPPAPLPSGERIEALDVLRGVALLGIFIMNMPGFTHSLFTPPVPGPGLVDALVVALRDVFFAGKFNLLFGLLFGIGFTLQLGRLEAARPGSGVAVVQRRLAALLAIGLVHAILVWPGDVLVVYAVLGFALLAARHLEDRALLALLALCLAFPALWEAARPLLFSFQTETVAAFEYQEFERSNAAAFGAGSFLDAMRESARMFAWSYSSPLGLYSYAAYYVQMATGILLGLLVGRRRWIERLDALRAPIRHAHAVSGLVALGAGAAWLGLGGAAGDPFVGNAAAMLARTIGRAALMVFYALGVVRLLGAAPARRWLRSFALAGRMPLSNYLLQTLLGTFVFYGWGLGFWGRATPLIEVLLAAALFFVVQLPLSAAWLARFRYGPVEYLWRRLTYERV